MTQIKANDDDDFEPVQIEWESVVEVSNVTLKGGTEYWHFDDAGTSGTATMGEGDGPDSQEGQRPNSPCPDGSCGVKFNRDGENFEPDDHQDTCE